MNGTVLVVARPRRTRTQAILLVSGATLIGAGAAALLLAHAHGWTIFGDWAAIEQGRGRRTYGTLLACMAIFGGAAIIKPAAVSLFGWTRLSVGPAQLELTHGLGPFRWTRSMPTADVRKVERATILRHGKKGAAGCRLYVIGLDRSWRFGDALQSPDLDRIWHVLQSRFRSSTRTDIEEPSSSID